MKKIFTFLVSAFIMGSAFAQFGQDNQRGYDKGNDVAYNDHKHKKDKDFDKFYFSKRERDMKIAEINREFNYKIQSVKNKFFMNRFRKERMISELEGQRRDEIRKVNAKFYDRRNRFDDNDDKKGRW